MTNMNIDPISDKIEIKNSSFMEDCKMKYSDFKQLCFEKGWEGTLFKLLEFDRMVAKAAADVMNKAFAERIKDHKK